MSDRTSAEIFGMVFRLLAEDPTEKNKQRAREFWKKARSYDFSDYQLYCDDALIALGLARRGIDPEYPEDGETIIYGLEES